MAEKKSSAVKPDEKATMLAKTEKLKAMAVKEPSEVQAAPKPEEKLIKEPQAVKPEESKAEAKKEPDPSKEFVEGIMTDMALKGAPKKRLIKTLVEQYGMDKQKVMFRLKRALITERYAAAHAEA
ncbi:MAG: hypothetical protein Q8O17_02365, partial [Candidatus Methanoperedens sp.]|nr:hypothetical protein [Candidatus Methanoperedens sp.]